MCVPNFVQEINDCVWSERRWTLQETVLSRRRLVFSKSQAYFQCRNMHCCEAVPICLETAHIESLERFRQNIWEYRAFPLRGIGETGIELEAQIQEYLGRYLSVESDALNAFLGIFTHFKSSSIQSFIFGAFH